MKNWVKFDIICDKIFDLIHDESRPLAEVKAEIERLKKIADKLDLEKIHTGISIYE